MRWSFVMTALVETICVKRWQVFAMLGLSGYAVGNLIAKAVGALGL